MSATISPDALKTSAAQFRKELLLLPVMKLEKFLRHATLRTGVRQSETVGTLSTSAALGPYNPATKTSGATIDGRTLKVYLGSMIHEFDPNDLRQTVYGSAISKGQALGDTEIARQMVALLAAKAGDSLYRHVFDASTTSTATGAFKLFDGFGTIIDSEITDGKISTTLKNRAKVDVSAISGANAVTTLKTFYRAASDELRDQPTKLFVPVGVYDNYCDDYQTVTGRVAYNDKFDQTFLEGSNNLCELVPLSCCPSDKLILTTKSNMLVGVNQESDEETVAVEKFSSFALTFSMAMYFGVQFESIAPERLFIGNKITADN